MEKKYSTVTLTKKQKKELKEKHPDKSYGEIIDNLSKEEELRKEVKDMAKSIKKEIRDMKKDMEERWDRGVHEMKSLRKHKKKKLREWELRARKKLLPFCHTCWAIDYADENVQQFDYYTNAEFIRERPIKETNINKSNYMEPIGVMRDYVCTNKFDKKETDPIKRGRKHRISVEVTRRELSDGYFEKFKPEDKGKPKK